MLAASRVSASLFSDTLSPARQAGDPVLWMQCPGSTWIFSVRISRVALS